MPTFDELDMRRKGDTTIKGGLYLAADGVSYIDCNGKPIAVEANDPERAGAAEDSVNLSRLSRTDLETIAIEAGMTEEEARSARNIPLLIEFIEAQTAPLAEQGPEGA